MVLLRGGPIAGLILSCLILSACQSAGGGSYIGRNEFDRLAGRVANLEYSVQSLGGNLPLTASTSTSGPDGPVYPAAQVPLPPPDSSALLPPAGQPAARAPANAGERSLYQQGQSLLKQKKYNQAANLFNQMLNQHPGGRLAPNARYWLGECYYAQGRFREAAAEFQRCASDYPQSAKAPDALLKLSYSYDRLGEGPQAMAALDQLLSRYPRSNAAAMMKSGRGRFSG